MTSRMTTPSDGDFLDDKSITALGVLQTIGTLILTLESTPDVLLHIEAILMPVIQVTLENKLYGKRWSRFAYPCGGHQPVPGY